MTPGQNRVAALLVLLLFLEALRSTLLRTWFHNQYAQVNIALTAASGGKQS